jgi:hypothetical protein
MHVVQRSSRILRSIHGVWLSLFAVQRTAIGVAHLIALPPVFLVRSVIALFHEHRLAGYRRTIVAFAKIGLLFLAYPPTGGGMHSELWQLVARPPLRFIRPLQPRQQIAHHFPTDGGRRAPGSATSSPRRRREDIRALRCRLVWTPNDLGDALYRIASPGEC